jgi:hypothetical protein
MYKFQKTGMVKEKDSLIPMNKTDFDCCIILSNYLWNGKSRDQGHSIHYLAHEMSSNLQKPVFLINLVPFVMLRRYISAFKVFMPGIHTSRGIPLTVINGWGPDWRDAAHNGEKLPVKRLRKLILRAVHQSGLVKPLLIFTEPTTLPLVKALKDQFLLDTSKQGCDIKKDTFPIIWFCSDNFPVGDPRRAGTILKAIDEIGQTADAICTVSPTLEKVYQTMLPTLLLRNAADRRFFQQVKTDMAQSGKDPLGQGIRRKRIVYIGMMNQRIDYPALEKAVREHPEHSFVFIGEERIKPGDDYYDMYTLIKNSENTFFTGVKNRQEVAEIFSICDIGIIPYAMTPFNLSCGPLKLYEYAAADLPTISTSLPAVEHSRSYAYLVDDGDISAAIEKVVADYDFYKERIIAFSKENTYSDRVQALFNYVKDIVGT